MRTVQYELLRPPEIVQERARARKLGSLRRREVGRAADRVREVHQAVVHAVAAHASARTSKHSAIARCAAPYCGLLLCERQRVEVCQAVHVALREHVAAAREGGVFATDQRSPDALL